MPPYAKKQKCTYDEFEICPRNSNTLDYDQISYPAHILYLIGHYEQFFLTKNNMEYPFNRCHFKRGNDLYVVDERYYDDEINKLAYFYLRRTSLQREYDGIDDGYEEEYYIITIDRSRL